MKTLCALMFLSFIVSGCFTSMLVTPTGANGDLSYTQFNERIGDDEVTVVLDHGEKVNVKAVYITADTVSWVVLESQAHIEMPTNTLDQVVSTDHGLGALIGLGIGGVAVTGILFATTRGVTGESGGLVGPIILIGGGGAAVIGGIFGGLAGWRHRYEFSNDTQDKRTQEKAR